jgi:serine/threonine protein kinase
MRSGSTSEVPPPALSFLHNDVCVTNAFMGTPAYLAPEVWRREPYGAKAEVWSLGVVLCQLIALRVPFAGSTVPRMCQRVCAGELPPEVRALVSDPTYSLLTLMLQPDPRQRPTLGELRELPFVRRMRYAFYRICRQRRLLPDEELAALIAEEGDDATIVFA